MHKLAVLVLALLPAAAVAAPPPSPWKKGVPGAGKAPPACGVKVLPLNVGNTWTYSQVTAPVGAREELTRITPQPPKTIVVVVKSIEIKGTDTVATLEETSSYEIREMKAGKLPRLVEEKITSTITCGPKKFEISPESFFFAGEPGGFKGIVFDKLERKKDPGWKLTNGTIGDAEWTEEIVAHWTRQPYPGVTANLGAGRLELERKFIPQEPQPISTRFAGEMVAYMAEKLAVSVTGRVFLDSPLAPEGKPCTVKEPDGKDKDGNPKTKDVAVVQCDLPANWVNQLWLVDNVGVVQVLNTYAHMYQLSDASLK